MKIFLFLLVVIFVSLIGCSTDDKTQQQKVQSQTEENENPADTNLTPEEKFSSSILVDFLAESGDEDLASFLETEIYKQSLNYNGAAVVEVTPSTWLVSYEKEGNIKNYLLQKYVDFKTNEYYFTLKETNVSITDVISRISRKIPAGE